MKQHLFLVQIVLALLTAGWALTGVGGPAFAQDRPAIRALAACTAHQIEKEHPVRILIAPLKDCIVDADTCSAFENALQADLRTSQAGLQFIGRDAAIAFLKSKGLMSIDAYNIDALDGAALGLQAETLVAENLDWEHSHYEMTVEVRDAAKDKDVAKLNARMAAKPPDFGDKPIFVKDPETGVSMLVPVAKHTAGTYYPQCEHCPDRHYTEEARRRGLQGTALFLATVSDHGTVEQLVLINLHFDFELRQRTFRYALSSVFMWLLTH